MGYRDSNQEWTRATREEMQGAAMRRRQRPRGPRGRRDWGGGFAGGVDEIFAGFGPFGGPGSGRGRGRGARVRRGDVRAAILDVLATADGEVNGYQVIQAIADRTDNQWKPSPGSIYPTISQLEDEGLVVTGVEAGRKSLSLTDAGRLYVAEHPEELAAVWAGFEDDAEDSADERVVLKNTFKKTVHAAAQFFHAASPEQQAKAADVLEETRKKLYAILAEDDEE